MKVAPHRAWHFYVFAYYGAVEISLTELNFDIFCKCQYLLYVSLKIVSVPVCTVSFCLLCVIKYYFGVCTLLACNSCSDMR